MQRQLCRLQQIMRLQRSEHDGRQSEKWRWKVMMKTTVVIDGMMCGMCESHINEAIRKALNVKKVSASRKKKEAVILSEDSLDPVLLEETIRQTGYTPGEIHTEEYERKSLLSHITGEI